MVHVHIHHHHHQESSACAAAPAQEDKSADKAGKKEEAKASGSCKSEAAAAGDEGKAFYVIWRAKEGYSDTLGIHFKRWADVQSLIPAPGHIFGAPFGDFKKFASYDEAREYYCKRCKSDAAPQYHA